MRRVSANAVFSSLIPCCGSAGRLTHRSSGCTPFILDIPGVLFSEAGAVDAAATAALDYPHLQSADDMGRQIEALKSFDPTKEDLAFPTPMLALLAADDLLLPEAEARTALSAIPGVRIHTLPDVGHALHWDDPDALCRLILDFLADDPADSANAD